jgi:hypothetical protein
MLKELNKKVSGVDLEIFQTILDFVTNLQEYFGNSKHVSVHSLNLYNRLISKMGFKDDDLILRHIEVFKVFCIQNRECIREQRTDFTTKIVFSEKIYIDLEYIFKHADIDTTKIIWEYILAISAFVDPENKTKQLLKDLIKDDNNENNFIVDMISQLGSSGAVGGNGNPMEMIGSLMNSDLFSTIMSSMDSKVENGNLDLSKLMGSVVGIVNNVKNEIEKSNDPMLKNLVNMLQLPSPENTGSGE